VAEIAALLKDEEQSVRAGAVRALGAAGAARETAPARRHSLLQRRPCHAALAAAEAVVQISPLNPQELTSCLSTLCFADLRPLTRLAAYGASGGERDGLLIVRLLVGAAVRRATLRPRKKKHVPPRCYRTR
jgi:HEAT repeat protein